MSDVTLCLDTASRTHPELIGLEGEQLEAQDWLALYTQGDQARAAVRENGAREVWVAGSDDVDAINLAAVIKSERAGRRVCLLAFEPSGSLHSRARAAGIDEVLDRPSFAAQYLRRKHESSGNATAPHPPVGSLERAVSDTPAAAARPARVQTTTTPVAQTGVHGKPPAAPAERPGPAVQPAPAPAPSMQQEPPVRVLPGMAQGPVGAAEPRVLAVPAVPAPTGGASAAQAHRGFVLTVVGAGGGTGKGSVAVLAACASAASRLSTVVVDADAQFGDVHCLMGVEQPLRLDQAVAAPARLDALKQEGDKPAVLAAPERLEQSEVVCGQLPSVVERLRQRFEVVVVSTGPWYNDVQMQLIEQATNVLFVIDQRPSSLRACKHALSLCARCGVAAQPFLFALNRCSRQALFSSIDVSCALQGAHVDELQDGGREVEELLGAGQPLELLDSKNAFAGSVKRLMSDILPRAAAQPDPASVPAASTPARRRNRFGIRANRKKAACL